MQKLPHRNSIVGALIGLFAAVLVVLWVYDWRIALGLSTFALPSAWLLGRSENRK